MDIRILEQAEQHTLVNRATCARGELAQLLATLVPRAFEALGRSEASFVDGPFTRFLGQSAHALEVEVGVVVDRPVAVDGRWRPSTLPGGPAAVANITGIVDHDAVRDWVKDQGRTVIGAPWEVYLTDPDEQPDRAKWVTRVCYPLA